MKYLILHTAIWQKDHRLEKGQLIQLDDVSRIKLAFKRNQGQLALFACYLVFKIGNSAVNVTEII